MDSKRTVKRKGSKGGLKFGPPVDLPKANTWKPHAGETRTFIINKVVVTKFGDSYLVVSEEDDEQMFLPSHIYLKRLLEASEVASGDVYQIKCTKAGSKRKGDTYQYEVRKAK